MHNQDSQNPLLNIQHPIPFNWIQAGHIEPAVTQLIRETQERLEALAQDSAPRTFVNTLHTLDTLTEPLDTAMKVTGHLEGVATSPEFRTAYNAVEPLATALYSSIPLHEGLWKVVKAYAATSEAASLTGVRKRFLQKTLDNFRRAGADLNFGNKEKLTNLNVELAKFTTQFEQNVLDATNAYELVITNEMQLAGLPQSAIDAARQSAVSKGQEGWRFTLQAPSYNAGMTYLDNAEIRKTLYLAYNVHRATSGKNDNRKIIVQILELRKQKASLLGYRDFADMVLEDRMAKTGERAFSFVSDLRKKTETFFRKEVAELQKFRSDLENTATLLEPWDIGYYAEKLRKTRYDFDEEALRPFFSFEKVLAGVFAVAQRLYGIRISQVGNLPVWDPAVTGYEVQNADGTRIAMFYADWYPRENKRQGAWMDAFIVETPPFGETRHHVGLICGNVTPPVAGKPALLTHREVETVFHEFGRLLHLLLSRVELKSFAGTNVAWDFVELPSQIMENWTWERDVLDMFARHYETNETIPEELYQKMRRTRTFWSASTQMRQLSFGTIDLLLHREYAPERDGDVLAYARNIQQQFAPAPLPTDYAMLTAFTHLFGGSPGYAAGYYSYKWAEVLDADAFGRFREDGILNPAVGAAFRDTILSRGDSEAPEKLFRDFRGRDPDPNALLERLGLTKRIV